MTARSIVAREHAACTVFSNVTTFNAKRELFAGMSARDQHYAHRSAEFFTAEVEYRLAIRDGRTVDEQRWLDVKDRISCELDAMEDLRLGRAA